VIKCERIDVFKRGATSFYINNSPSLINGKSKRGFASLGQIILPPHTKGKGIKATGLRTTLFRV